MQDPWGAVVGGAPTYNGKAVDNAEHVQQLKALTGKPEAAVKRAAAKQTTRQQQEEGAEDEAGNEQGE